MMAYVVISNTCTHTHAHTDTHTPHTHARRHARTHAPTDSGMHKHTHLLPLYTLTWIVVFGINVIVVIAYPAYLRLLVLIDEMSVVSLARSKYRHTTVSNTHRNNTYIHDTYT